MMLPSSHSCRAWIAGWSNSHPKFYIHAALSSPATMWRIPSPPHLDSLAAHGTERPKRKRQKGKMAKSCSQATRNTTVICGEGEVIIWQVQRQKRAMINGDSAVWPAWVRAWMGSCLSPLNGPLRTLKCPSFCFCHGWKAAVESVYCLVFPSFTLTFKKGQDLQHQVCEQYWCPQRGCQGIQFPFPT